jgi:hypothetical protein
VPGEPLRRNPGDRVQVLDERARTWKNAIIQNRWSIATIPAGDRAYEYEVIGNDDAGPFTGTFDSDHIRDRPREDN